MIYTFLIDSVFCFLLIKLAKKTEKIFFQLILSFGIISTFLLLGLSALSAYNTSIETTIGLGTMILCVYYFKHTIIAPNTNKDA